VMPGALFTQTVSSMFHVSVTAGSNLWATTPDQLHRPV
jgi:hypothetical protein